MASHPSVPVVCAVIRDDSGCVLLGQRPEHKHLGLKWEFPGGKVEPQENPQNALRREIQEELGCEIVITGALPSFVHDYGHVQIEMFPFCCVLAPHSPTPQPREHRALRWVAIDALKTYDLAAADWPVVECLQKAD